MKTPERSEFKAICARIKRTNYRNDQQNCSFTNQIRFGNKKLTEASETVNNRRFHNSEMHVNFEEQQAKQ